MTGIRGWDLLIGLVAALLIAWLALIATLAIVRPRGGLLREALRLPPDVLRLVRRLAADRDLPRGVRVRLALLLAYLAFPIDVVPDFIPVLGYADDAIIVVAVLRSASRQPFPDCFVLDDMSGDALRPGAPGFRLRRRGGGNGSASLKARRSWASPWTRWSTRWPRTTRAGLHVTVSGGGWRRWWSGSTPRWPSWPRPGGPQWKACRTAVPGAAGSVKPPASERLGAWRGRSAQR
jgi:uncharacterized membrane protein YkvA (DUF1232 family)